MISAQEFYETEIARLREILNKQCEKCYDPEAVYVTISEWAEGLTENVIIFNVEETPMDEIFGTKVRLKNSGQGTDGVLVDHGIVGANLFFYDEKNKPLFYDLDYGEPYPRLADFDSFEAYQEACEQQQQQETNQKLLHKQLAGTLFVRWFDKKGAQVCQGWHASETLQSIE
jgi:hypothetical protein